MSTMNEEYKYLPIDNYLNLTVQILHLESVESLSYGQVIYFGKLYSTGDYTSDTFHRQFHDIMTGETIRLLKGTYVNITNITFMTRIIYSNNTNQEIPK